LRCFVLAGSENDIRCQVTRRKVSARTRGDIGRDCRDAFLASPKPAPTSRSRSGITSETVSPSQAPRLFRLCRKSSSPELAHPDATTLAPLTP
jgi:hypothetical protein